MELVTPILGVPSVAMLALFMAEVKKCGYGNSISDILFV
jgi:hypothetical protein